MKGRLGQVALLQLILVIVLGAIFTFAAMPFLQSNGQKQVDVVETATTKGNALMDEAVGTK